MRPEDIRRLYQTERAASDEEARATQTEAQTDPAVARSLLATLAALASEDAQFALLWQRVMLSALYDLIGERAASDDAYALRLGQMIVAIQNATTPPKTPRGKQARSA